MDAVASNVGALAALVALSAFVVRFVLNKVWALVERQQAFMQNHLEHNTVALIELKAAVVELRAALATLAASR